MVGGIEAGGTKTICAVGTGPNDIVALERFETEAPDVTLGKCLAMLESHGSSLEAVGIATFGPVDLDPASSTFGYVTNTPKTEWQNVDFMGTFKKGLGLPVGLDTDVNGAALGENRWGAAQDLDTFVYFTIGTGIGGGGMVNGAPLHGLLHPEMGHVYVPHDWEEDPYEGWCLYHGDCWEGLAAGPALEGRWKVKGETLPADHAAWALEAKYIAAGIINVLYAISPQLVILSGGVMHNEFLYEMVRSEVRRQMNGYLQAPCLLHDLENYIVPPVLGDRAGVLGAFVLAQQAAALATS